MIFKEFLTILGYCALTSYDSTSSTNFLVFDKDLDSNI